MSGILERRPLSSAPSVSRPTGTGQKGSFNGRWKGGRQVTFQGYLKVYSPNHPNATRNLMEEHRLVMEKHLGRYLESSEVVHHKNHNKLDNRIENLELMSNEEHSRRHSIGNRWKPRSLNLSQENHVRKLYKTGSYSMKALAKKFKVGTTCIFLTIHRLDNGSSHRHKRTAKISI